MAQVPVIPPPPSSPRLPKPKPQQTRPDSGGVRMHVDGARARRASREVEVFRELRRRILAGVYAPGKCLSPLSDIGDEFGVAESVVQKAAARLREMGFIRTEPGRGTWVADTITDRARMRAALDAACSGVLADDMFGPDAGPLVTFPAAWIARLLDESEAHEPSNLNGTENH